MFVVGQSSRGVLALEDANDLKSELDFPLLIETRGLVDFLNQTYSSMKQIGRRRKSKLRGALLFVGLVKECTRKILTPSNRKCLH